MHVVALVHPGADREQLRRVEVEHALRLRVVAAARVVAGHEQHVLEPERPGGEQVGLQREPVPVAARLLEDRLEAHVEHRARGREARQVQRRALVVGDVERVADRAEQLARVAASPDRSVPRGGATSPVTTNVARLERVAQAAHDAPSPFARRARRACSTRPGFSFVRVVLRRQRLGPRGASLLGEPLGGCARACTRGRASTSQRAVPHRRRTGR